MDSEEAKKKKKKKRIRGTKDTCPKLLSKTYWPIRHNYTPAGISDGIYKKERKWVNC